MALVGGQVHKGAVSLFGLLPDPRKPGCVHQQTSAKQRPPCQRQDKAEKADCGTGLARRHAGCHSMSGPAEGCQIRGARRVLRLLVACACGVGREVDQDEGESTRRQGTGIGETGGR